MKGQKAEKEIQTEILNYLRGNGYMAWKNHSGGIRRSGKATARNPNAGAPDIFAIKGGMFYGIEVKTKDGRIGVHQYQWLDQLRLHGGHAVIATSLEECIKGIEDCTGWDL